ncbi:unnamed protein product [Clonostachys rosea]|uniref:Uncharacterized protein n=1 Tax=Bionectria ochroleuca TaxID=29856 RepID=A0ABY6U2R2_BIOOC|nr:unnamed protein product [Clonostachys rosea]
MASGDRDITTHALERLADQIRASIGSDQGSPHDWAQTLRHLRSMPTGSYNRSETVKEKHRTLLLRRCVVNELDGKDTEGRFHRRVSELLNLLHEEAQEDQQEK